jgi:hypothetical protein
MKRIILFIAACILFAILGLIGIDNITIFTTLVLPCALIGQILRDISLSGIFGNIIAIMLFLLISLLPVGYLFFLGVKKRRTTIDIILLPIMSMIIAIVIYLFINSQILLTSINPQLLYAFNADDLEMAKAIIFSGLSYILYLFVLVYLLLKAYVNHKLNSIKLFRLTMDCLIVLLALSVLTVALSELKANISLNDITVEQTFYVFQFLSTLLTTSLTIYMVDTIRTMITQVEADGFQVSLKQLSKKLYLISFILIITTLTSQALLNTYQLLYMEQFLNLKFTFDVPVVTLLIVSVVLILSRYLSTVIDLKEEHDLII